MKTTASLPDLVPPNTEIFSQIQYFILFISHWSHPTPRVAKIYNTPILNMAIAKSGTFSVVKKPQTTHIPKFIGNLHL